MAEFQRKPLPFLHAGMNWNTPVEKLADGQVAWAKNARILERGSISSAHGYNDVFPSAHLSDVYLHSLSRLNILNTEYDTNVRRTYVMGGDGLLYVFQNSATLTNNFGGGPQLNPVTTPLGQFVDAGGQPVFSGNPLSIVDMQPVGAGVAWKYIGDSRQMVTVGYYPTDHAGFNMARCLTVGLRPPVNTNVPSWASPVGGGNLNGSYQWAFAYRRINTGARSNPSAATRFTISTPGIPTNNQSVMMVLPSLPNDPQTGAPDPTVTIDIYRFGGSILRWALVGSGAGGTTFVDNTPDINLLAAPSPPQVTDASTGQTRFNLFQPFVTGDIDHHGTCLTTTAPNGAMHLHFSGGTDGTPPKTTGFDVNWLPGSTIIVAGHALTIYQVLSSIELEIMDNTTGLNLGLNPHWSTPAGTLHAGQPLAHLWGPYGIGQSGSYLFACGDPNATGTLYWTNGNDPDSTDIVNNIIVTSPSEKLVSGCVYNGQPYVWSTERQFEIFPSLTVFGQFTTQEMAGAKGCWLEWSLSVQSNGFADQSVTWRGKDGLYDWSASGGLQRITDPLYAFFPHDGNPGIAPETIMPFIGAGSEHPESVGNLDDGQPKYHRTCWFHGLLFYDFVAQTENTSGASVNTFSTLVWDTVNIPGGGWVSLDQPFPITTPPRPVARFVEVGANDVFPIPGHNLGLDNDTPESGVGLGPARRGGNMKVTWGGIIYDYDGFTRGFETRIVTRAEDMGDSRAPKLWGDYWFDCSPVSQITIVPLVNFNLANITPNTIPQAAGFPPPPTLPPPPPSGGVERTQYTLDFFDWMIAGGKGLLNNTLGLDVRWLAPDGQFTTTINQWQPSFIVKPEVLSFRAQDRSDENATQAKYLMGMNMEANTNIFDVTPVPSFVLNVIIDGQVIAQPLVQHDGQTIKPYAWEPVAGYEFQVQMSYPQGVNWQLFKVNWLFEPWPDAIARKYPFQNLGTSGAKYIRGIVMPMETGGQPGTVNLWGDDADTNYNWTKTTENLKKTGKVLDLPAPFVAHEIQFSTKTNCRIWPGEVKVDFDPWPEMSTDVSSFTDLGYQGSKFFQGIVFSAETGGQPRQITVNSDCGTSVTLPVVQTPSGCKNTFAFSFSPCNNPPSEPFIASQVQIVPDGDIRIWNDETRYVWEPEPELVATYQTQPTDHDMATWHHLRDCFIAYRGGSGAPTLYIQTEYGTESYLLDYVGPNVYTRCYRVLKPQKAKWRSYRVEGCGLIRLYIKDCAVRVKEWGSTGPYVSAQPFGELSRTNGGARI